MSCLYYSSILGGEPGTSGEGQVMMEYTVETVKMEATAPSNAEATGIITLTKVF